MASKAVILADKHKGVVVQLNAKKHEVGVWDLENWGLDFELRGFRFKILTYLGSNFKPI